jgi:hypothetical protein
MCKDMPGNASAPGSVREIETSMQTVQNMTSKLTDCEVLLIFHYKIHSVFFLSIQSQVDRCVFYMEN